VFVLLHYFQNRVQNYCFFLEYARKMLFFFKNMQGERIKTAALKE